jgi:two-component sensor histidine kinase
VADDGAGLPPDLDFQATESLGLQLVNTLVDQLDGVIELDGSRGTAFKITFAVP